MKINIEDTLENAYISFIIIWSHLIKMTSGNELHRERKQRSKLLLVATICDSNLHKSLEKHVESIQINTLS